MDYEYDESYFKLKYREPPKPPLEYLQTTDQKYPGILYLGDPFLPMRQDQLGQKMDFLCMGQHHNLAKFDYSHTGGSVYREFFAPLPDLSGPDLHLYGC